MVRVFPPSEIYNVINCALWTLGVGVAAILLYYLGAAARHVGGLRNLLMAYPHRMRDQTVVALLVLDAGATLFRFWTWLGVWVQDRGGDVRWMLELPWACVPGLTSGLEAVGFACVIRVLAPNEWTGNGWWLCVASALAATTVLSVFPR